MQADGHPLEYSRVHGNIWIGSILSVADSVIEDIGAGLVIKCDSETGRVNGVVPTVVVAGFDDAAIRSPGELAAIVEKIEAATAKMKEFLDANPQKAVLVHCLGGQNRSALVIGMYLKRYHGMEYKQIYDALITANARRGVCALWNTYFQDLLKGYQV